VAAPAPVAARARTSTLPPGVTEALDDDWEAPAAAAAPAAPAAPADTAPAATGAPEVVDEGWD